MQEPEDGEPLYFLERQLINASQIYVHGLTGLNDHRDMEWLG